MLTRLALIAALGLALASPAVAQDRQLSDAEINDRFRGQTATSTAGATINYYADGKYYYSNPQGAHVTNSSGKWWAEGGRMCVQTQNGKRCDAVWMGPDGRVFLKDSKGWTHRLSFSPSAAGQR